MNRSTSGFTIVELLIVIVVIGILAAITLVAFGGIRDRAKNASIEQTASTYYKLLKAYAVEHSSYPVTQSTCLGETAMYSGGGCAHGSTTETAALATALKSVSSSLPKVDETCFSMYTGCRRNLALVREPSWNLDGQPHTWYMIYYLGGNGDCTIEGALGGSFSNFQSNASRTYVERNSGTTMCVLPLLTT